MAASLVGQIPWVSSLLASCPRRPARRDLITNLRSAVLRSPAVPKSEPKKQAQKDPSAVEASKGTPPVAASAQGRRHPWIGGIDLVSTLLLLGCVWGVLPARWWPVDVLATLLGALLAASGGGLLTGTPWARRVGLAAGVVTLVLGLALVTTLALTASYLSGVYGPVGRGGAVILVLVGALSIPYFIVFPAAKIVALRKPT